MRIEIEISEGEIQKLVIEKVAEKVLEKLVGENFDIPYEHRKKDQLERMTEIIRKIDWKNAGSQLSETVIQKFFLNLLEPRR